MHILEFFEKLADTAVFNEEKNEIAEMFGYDSWVIRKNLANRANFSDTTKIVSFELCD